MPDTSDRKRSLRQDAERNRELLVAAAREAFREDGANVPIAEIARRSGVSKATLYRRFPERSDLLAYVFADRLYDCVGSAEAALDHDDPWQGLVGHIRHLTELQLEDRAFTTVFLCDFPEGSDVALARTRAGDNLRLLLAAARAQGALRPDITETDIVLLLKANDGVLREAADPQAESERLVELMLRALHT